MTTTLVSPGLAYQNLLATHRDAMVEGLIHKHAVPHAYAELMIDQLWDRLTCRLAKDYAHLGVDLPLAERIMNEALGFLQLLSHSSGYGPSPLVDLGWHTFIKYTMEYHVFCDAIAGHYIHHLPDDVEGIEGPSDRNCSSPQPRPGAPGGCHNRPNCIQRTPAQEYYTTQDTVAAMTQQGPVNLELWSI